MTWRAARSLLVLHQQLQAGAPRARPPGTGADEWGLIGDAAHDPTSDHSPHDFPGLGSQVVTAADFPNRPDLGLDAHQVLDDIRRARDPRAKYGISNGQIFSNHPVDGYAAWEWRPYSGSSDKHYTHGHLSVVGDARADGEQPWPTIGGDDMTPEQDERLRNIDTWLRSLIQLDSQVPLLNAGKTSAWPDKLGDAVKEIRANVAALVDRPAVDPAALAATLAPLLAAGLDTAVSADAVLSVLQSPAGQTALVQAANAAEDS